MRCLTADLHDPTVIYAGTQGSGAFRSEDGGKTWHPAGLTGEVVKSIVVSPHAAGTLYAGVKPAYIHLTRDGGESWEELEGFHDVPGRRLWWSPAEKPGSAYVQGLAISPTDPNILLAGIEFGAVLRSTDGGVTWSKHRTGAVRDCHTLMFHPTNGDYAYEGGGGKGAAISRDGGNTWDQSKTGRDRHYGWAVAADPHDPELWYVSAAPGPGKAHVIGNGHAYIYRKHGGDPWEALGGGLPDPLPNMPYSLWCDPQESGHIYAGLKNGDMWFSADHGDSWTQLNVNLGQLNRTVLVFGE
jgi:hypothetical protein